MPGMIDVAPFLPWSLAATPAVAKEVLGEAVVARGVAAALEGEVRGRSDPAEAAAFRAACPVPGVGAEAYALRSLRLTGDVGVLAGIRFYGGDVARPFVGVDAQTRALTLDEQRAATPELLDAFAAFGPQATWWWTLGDAAADAAAVPDQRLLLGSIPDLVRRPVDPGSVPFRLRRDDAGDSYGDYGRLFADYLAANPEVGARLVRSSPEDYAACARAGGLFVAEHKGAVAGVFAARPGEVRGVPGWLVEEELLAEGLRGRGLAPLLQRLALARLDTHERPLVMGTIDAGNLASWHTARRVGRSDVGGWHFMPDPRRPGGGAFAGP
jgi:L-amino acid N-acyltransferase YncA